MSLLSRLANVFRPQRLTRDIDDELASHMEEAIEQGRDSAEARRAFGSPLRHREESRDMRLIVWLDSLRADVIFGWRQLNKRKVTSAAAILSLALAIGACASAFRIIDALLLRPLPIADPQRLYTLSGRGTGPRGAPQAFDFWSYPAFRQMRAAVKDQAELIAVSNAGRTDLTLSPSQETEQAEVQYVSGNMFASFGLRPSLGRLLGEGDDVTPGTHPVAVLSYDYWTRRFAQDPNVIGKTFRLSEDRFPNGPYQIVGVGPERFTGSEPTAVIDIFLPTMMYAMNVNETNLVWLRTLVKLKPNVAVEPVRDRLRATIQSIHDTFNGESVSLEHAAAGVSSLQGTYRLALTALACLVGLVLLVACANVANLMSAQATARATEMALRISIGAGRGRLVQLVLVESAMLAFFAAAGGALFAWRSAPLVVNMINPPGVMMASLLLPLDWRVLGFSLALTLGVTVLFGLAPALRASRLQPSRALKGGGGSRRGMHALIAVQAAFSVVVLFVAGLFMATFNRLVHQPTGFSAERVLTFAAVTDRPQPPIFWDQAAERLRTVTGVEAVAQALFPLLSGSDMSARISIDGAPPSEDYAHRLPISPGWAEAMRIPLLDGRDFLASDVFPGVAMVNQAFARRYFDGRNPVGQSFDLLIPGGPFHCRIVGLVGDARYRDLHEPLTPTTYLPMNTADRNGGLTPRNRATFLVRAASPFAMASILRQEIARQQPQFKVKNIRTQLDINAAQTVRERLLATLALFFALVALLLAGVGLYGVLDYTVLSRRRELGIRMALGARATHVVWGVTVDVFAMLLSGAAAGLALGMASTRYISSLLYQVRPTDFSAVALPALAILAAAILAALPAVVRAVRIDPVNVLRSE